MRQVKVPVASVEGDSLDTAQGIWAFVKGRCCYKLFFIRLWAAPGKRIQENSRGR